MKNRKIYLVLIALFVFFSVSISAFAISGNYNMDSDTRLVGGGSFQMELMVPNQYTSSGLISDENDQYNGGPFCYFELEDEIDADSDFNFTIYFVGTLAKASYKNFINPIVIYDDVALSEENIVAKGSEGAVVALEDSFIDNPAPGYKASMSFYIPKGTLKEGKNYYLVFPKGSYFFSMSLFSMKESAVYQIKTKAAEPQGVVPVEGNAVLSSGAEFSFDAKQVDREKKETAASLSKDYGTGHYLIDGELDTKGSLDVSVQMSGKSGGKKYCKLNAFVYDSAELSNKVLTLSESPESGEDIVTSPKQLSIDGSKLEAGKTYYLVFAKDSKDGNQSFDEDVIFEFKMHTHTPVKVSGTEPKCETPGLTEGTKCLVCGDIVEAQEEIPPTGHQWKTYPQADPDCTHVGYTEHRQCTVCKKIEGFEEIPALGHKNADPVKENEVAATCEKEGSYDEVVYCSVCEEELSRETKKIDALGHKEAEPVKENEVAATCEKEGSYDEVVYCSVCKKELSREQKTIDKLPHTEEVVKGKAATCTEKGLTDGKKCSVCGEWIEEQKEIPALGHEEKVVKEAKAATCTEDGWTAEIECARCGELLQKSEPVKAKGHHEVYDSEVMSTCTETGLTFGIHCSECGLVIKEQVVVPKERHDVRRIAGKDATCTEKGLTDGEKCAVCGEILEAQKEIPALGHNYKDGVCTRCNEKDPNYKPAEPEPAPAEPEVPLNGIVKGKDGKWAMYKDDKVDTSYTGIAKNAYGWWRVEDGYVNFDAQGIYRNEYGWWKTTDGKVTFEETGIFKNEYGWWRVEDSKVNFDAQEIYKNKYGWWKTTDGKVTFEETGVFKNEYGWWRVEKSKVNFNAQEIYKNQYGWWKTTDGKVTFKETGIFKNEYGTWYVKDSKVDFSKNGIVNYNQKAYTVKDGKAKLA